MREVPGSIPGTAQLQKILARGPYHSLPHACAHHAQERARMFCIGIRAGLLQHRRIDTSSVSSFAFSCALGAHDERNAALLCCLWLVTRALPRGRKRAAANLQHNGASEVPTLHLRSAPPGKMMHNQPLSAAHFAVAASECVWRARGVLTLLSNMRTWPRADLNRDSESRVQPSHHEATQRLCRWRSPWAPLQSACAAAGAPLASA